MASAAVSAPGAAAEAGASAAAREADREAVQRLLERHGDHPSVALALNRAVEHFQSPDVEGVIAFRSRGGWRFLFGGVFAAPAERARLLADFLADSAASGRRVCAVQIRDEQVELFHRAGFRLNALGMSYSIELARFSLQGSKAKPLRRKSNAAARSGVRVVELGVDAPAGARQALDEITARWLRAKGRHVKMIEFLVGEVESVDRRGTRCLLAYREGSALGFITYAPAYGSLPGYMCDLTRRLPESPVGVTELINLEAVLRFQSESVPYLHFGLTPFVGIHDELGCHSRALAGFMHFLARHGALLYPAAALVDFKMKWSPQHIVQEYLAYQERFRIGCLWQLLRLTRSI